MGGIMRLAVKFYLLFLAQCPETNNRSVLGRSSAASWKRLQALAVLFYCSSSKLVNCKHQSRGEGTLPAAKDNCLLYNPAKSLIQQFSTNNCLALSHLESLWFSELPGADHQNRLCFHFPFSNYRRHLWVKAIIFSLSTLRCHLSYGSSPRSCWARSPVGVPS